MNINAVHTFTPAGGSWVATTSGGLQYEYRDLDIVRVQAENLFPGQQNVNQAVQRTPEQIRSRSKDLGFYVQEELLIADRLLLTGRCAAIAPATTCRRRSGSTIRKRRAPSVSRSRAD